MRSFFSKWNKTCNFCLTPSCPPPLCSRLQLSSRCVSEPCTTTKQVGSHLGANGKVRPPKVPPLHHNYAVISGSLPCYLGSLPCSRRGRIGDLIWARRHHQGRGDRGQSLVEGVEQRGPPRPVSRQLRGDHLDSAAQTHIHTQGHAPHVSSSPDSETLCSYFEKFLFPLNINKKTHHIFTYFLSFEWKKKLPASFSWVI